jgi:AraC-like DNA-binding protein
MFATLSFSITLLGIFTIFELLKSNQKLSLLKIHILARLILLTIGSWLDYIEFNGSPIPYYHEIFKIITSILFVNMLFLIVSKKIPKLVFGVEIIFTLFFIIELINGLQSPKIIDGQIQNKPNLSQLIFIGTYVFLAFSSIIYNGFQLLTDKNFSNNLYELKIKRWTLSYIICLLALSFINFLLILSLSKNTFAIYDNTMINSFVHRFLFILFILFRPKFLDDDKFARPFDQILAKNTGISFKNFEFLFYSNHYYLKQDANTEDLALKLNVSKNELSNFLRDEIEEKFVELLNKNRVEYLKELLKAKKYESFTIEALSEMAGFNNRRTMYNAFNKYVGQTPTEFIQNLK